MSTKCRLKQDKEEFAVGEDTLRGRVIAMYHSVLNFGKALNWSSRKTYDIVNGKQEPTAKDIEQMCLALNVQIPSDMRALFF